MGFKDVVVVFPDERIGSHLRIAAQIAQPEGHLTGLYSMPRIPPLFANGVPFFGTDIELRTIETMEAERRANAEARASEAEQAFRTAAERAELTSEWQVGEDDFVRTAVQLARSADIAVLGQHDPDRRAGIPHLAESMLLGSGGPVLVVPYAGRFEYVGRTVLVAWNGTRESARAVNDALPILENADKVVVFSVNPPDGPAWPGTDVARHLARHGAPAETSSSVSNDLDAGNAILSRAADFGSDLIVMGGYGHSRQRELILGGVTRTILQNMTVPVLFSH